MWPQRFLARGGRKAGSCSLINCSDMASDSSPSIYKINEEIEGFRGSPAYVNLELVSM
jgi:hypothetical protein